MTAAPTEVVQVLGRARAGDAVTATARALQARLARRGRSCRLVTPGAGPPDAMGDLRGTAVVVHTVDGGEALAVAADTLAGHALTIIHHGSSTGSDRATLRALRAATVRAVAADSSAREELRALGYRNVGALDPETAAGAFHDIAPAPDTAANLASHPGPFAVCVGPLSVQRGLEALIDGFATVTTHAHPSAVLSLCGPGDSWYRARLARHVATRGLQACEVVEPTDEGEVLARLQRADVIVALHPAALDPYLHEAVRRGVPVVAPRTARTSAVAAARLVAPSSLGAAALAHALAEALDRTAHTEPGGGLDDATLDHALFATLGLT